MRSALYLLWVTIMFGNGLGAAIVAIKLFSYRQRSRTFLYIAAVFAAIAVSTFITAWSIADMPHPMPQAYLIKRLVSLTIMGLAVWAAVFHFLGVWSGKN